MINFLYLLALFCPPLAALLCGRIVAVPVLLVLWIVGFLTGVTWVVAAIWAVLIVRDYKTDRQTKKLGRMVAHGDSH